MLLMEKESFDGYHSVEDNSDHVTYDLSWFRPAKVPARVRRVIKPSSLFASELAALCCAVGLVTLITGFVSVEQVAGLAGAFWIAQLATGKYSRRRLFWDEAYHLLKLCLLLCVAGVVLPFIAGADAGWAWLVWLFAFPLLLLFRYLVVRVLLSRGVWQRNAAIIGDSKNAIKVARALMEERSLGYKVICFFSAKKFCQASISIGDESLPVLPLRDEVEETLCSLDFPHVFVVLEDGGHNRFGYYVDKLGLNYPHLTIVPAFRGLPLLGLNIDGFFSEGVFMLNVRNNLTRPLSRFAKRAFDVVGASALVVLLSPLFAALWFAVRQSGPGVFFGHERVGFRGKTFKCYKFRSMVPNAQELLKELLATDPEAKAEWDREFKLKNDPRITSIGHFLRKTSLDELPQLWNVLKGDMSLVGPRPVIQEEVERYGENARHYLEAKPGMTGLWQVSGRNDLDYESRVQLDSWYVENWSMWTDFVILMRTVAVVLGRQGAY